jgi:hypothetical protein
MDALIRLKPLNTQLAKIRRHPEMVGALALAVSAALGTAGALALGAAYDHDAKQWPRPTGTIPECWI